MCRPETSVRRGWDHSQSLRSLFTQTVILVPVPSVPYITYQVYCTYQYTRYTIRTSRDIMKSLRKDWKRV
jgi:hypothetical protein